VKIARAGPNALDFHLSFYMGYIASRHPDARFVVVSNDKGYGPMLEHAAELGFSARQVGFDNAKVSAAKATAKRAPAKKIAPAKKVAAKKAAAKKVPVATKAASTTSATGGEAAVAARPVPAYGMAAAPKSPGTKANPVAARAPAKKSTSAKAVAVKKVATGSPSPVTKNLNQEPAKATAPIDLAKAANHVLASFKKTKSRPVKQRSLMASIQSLIGPPGDSQAVHAVLARLLASDKVAIDSKGGVEYKF